MPSEVPFGCFPLHTQFPFLLSRFDSLAQESKQNDAWGRSDSTSWWPTFENRQTLRYSFVSSRIFSPTHFSAFQCYCGRCWWSSCWIWTGWRSWGIAQWNVHVSSSDSERKKLIFKLQAIFRPDFHQFCLSYRCLSNYDVTPSDFHSIKNFKFR